MKLKLTRLVPSIALGCLLFASCKKEDAVSTQTQSAISPQNAARVTTMIGAVQHSSDQEFTDLIAAESAPSITGKGADVADDCPVITITPSKTVYPHTVKFDYGSGCVDENGVTKSGSRTVVVHADYKTAPAGTVIGVTSYSNYYVNGINISGNSVSKVATAASPGPLVMQVITHKTVSDGSGNTSTYIGVITRTQIAGTVSSPKASRDYSLKETAYGLELTPGEAPAIWKLNTGTVSPLIKSGTCLYFTQGVVHIILIDTHAVITHETLDYGSGSCDNAAMLTVDGGSPQAITLPFIFFTQHL